MPDVEAYAHVTSTLSAVVHRADGTVEDLGVISTTEARPDAATLIQRLRRLKNTKGVHHGRR